MNKPEITPPPLFHHIRDATTAAHQCHSLTTSDFGALVQGGSELSFDMPHINRDMVVVIQGLVILFCGALGNVFKGWWRKLAKN